MEVLWRWCKPVFARETSYNTVSPSMRRCEARTGMFKCQKRWKKQFPPLWKSCEAGASLFICGKHPSTLFSPSRANFFLNEVWELNDMVVPILVAVRILNDIICLSRSEKVAEFAWCVVPYRLKLTRLCQKSWFTHTPLCSFHYYGSPVRLVQACLCGGKTWSRRFIHREGAVKHV